MCVCVGGWVMCVCVCVQHHANVRAVWAQKTGM